MQKIEEENKRLRAKLKDKNGEYDQLVERYKAICASYCFILGTDFD